MGFNQNFNSFEDAAGYRSSSFEMITIDKTTYSLSDNNISFDNLSIAIMAL